MSIAACRTCASAGAGWSQRRPATAEATSVSSLPARAPWHPATPIRSSMCAQPPWACPPPGLLAACAPTAAGPWVEEGPPRAMELPRGAAGSEGYAASAARLSSSCTAIRGGVGGAAAGRSAASMASSKRAAGGSGATLALANACSVRLRNKRGRQDGLALPVLRSQPGGRGLEHASWQGLSRGHACVTRPRWPALDCSGGASWLQRKARRAHQTQVHLPVVYC